MGLSNDLLSQFAKVTKADKNTKVDTTRYGTIKVVGNSKYVQLDGSDLLTPVSVTADIKNGDRVTVEIKNHTAVVTGNMTSPAARTDDVKEVEQTANDAKEQADLAVKEATVSLRIDSSRGTVFKNNNVSTVLSAVIYKGSKCITDIVALHEEFGSGAYLEWLWQRMDDDRFGVIVSTDKRIGNNGFTLTLSPDDVDTKVVFKCQLITTD